MMFSTLRWLPLVLLCARAVSARAESNDVETTRHPAAPVPPFAARPGVTSHSNPFGGQDFRLPNGEQIESRRNPFGGQDYRFPDGRTVSCKPNPFGGQDCR